jgi:hypothetical protein
MNGYGPKGGDLDTTNPPDDFTAIEHTDQQLGELLRQMPKGYELIHDYDGMWYYGRRVKGGDFVPAAQSAYEALARLKEA